MCLWWMQLRLTMRPEHGLGAFHSRILTTANGYKSPCSVCRLLLSLSLRSMRMSMTTTTVGPALVQSSQCKFLVPSLSHFSPLLRSCRCRRLQPSHANFGQRGVPLRNLRGGFQRILYAAFVLFYPLCSCHSPCVLRVCRPRSAQRPEK